MVEERPESKRRSPLWTVSLVLMAFFYLVAGVNHFRIPEFYLNIMPPYLPAARELVLLSGVAEIVLGVVVLVPKFRRLACYGLIAMLVAFLPVHVHMLVNAEELYPELPVVALWLRFPVQVLFGLWAYWHSRD